MGQTAIRHMDSCERCLTPGAIIGSDCADATLQIGLLVAPALEGARAPGQWQQIILHLCCQGRLWQRHAFLQQKFYDIVQYGDPVYY